MLRRKTGYPVSSNQMLTEEHGYGASSPNYQIISADGHTIEPPHMWETYLPAKFHDRMPRLVKDPKGGDAWELVPGAPPMPLGLVTSAGPWGKRYEELEWYGSTYDNIRAGAFDGKARLEDQDIDGVSAEVLYPSQRTMSTFMAQPDDDYHLAGIDAYNQWMHDEFMAADPQATDRSVPDAVGRHRRVGGQAAAKRRASASAA